MARIPLISERRGLDDETTEVFDWIVGSRGSMLRPFEVLLHSPRLARRVAELGHVVRYESGLGDVDRELAILATGRAQGCGYVWSSHLRHAESAGVPAATITAVETGDHGGLDERSAAIVHFATALCHAGAVSDETFAAVRDVVGSAGVVELAVTVGYYTMMGYAMSVADVC